MSDITNLDLFGDGAFLDDLPNGQVPDSEDIYYINPEEQETERETENG